MRWQKLIKYILNEGAIPADRTNGTFSMLSHLIEWSDGYFHYVCFGQVRVADAYVAYRY